MPATITSAYGAFRNSSLEVVVFEDGMKLLPAGIFYGASRLSDVTLADTIVEIKGSAFYGCSKLEELTIPESVTTMGREFIKDSGVTVLRLNGKITSADGMLSGSGLKSVNWPDGLVNVESDAFSGVDMEATAYITENSPGMYAAIRSGLYVVFTGMYEDSSAEVLDVEKSRYYYTAGQISYGKYTSFYIDYVCKKEIFNEISNPYIEVLIPDGMQLSLEYIELDGEFISMADKAYDFSEHLLRIPVSKSEGHISIMMKTESTGKVATYASLVYEKDGEQFVETIGTITVEMPSLSMECSDSTTNGELYIQGMTNPFRTVCIYVNNEKTDTVKADATGNYSTTIQLTKKGENVVKTVLETDSTVSVTKYVEYKEDAILLCLYVYRTG